MYRITDQSIKSMSYIFFNCISRFEVDKNRIFSDPSLVVKTTFEEIVVKEIDDYLNQVSLLFLDKEDGFPDFDEILLRVKRSFFQELAASDLLDKDGFEERLKKFIKETQPTYMTSFFDEIIQEAKILQEKKKKMFDRETGQKFSELIMQVLKIYEEANGEPDHSPNVECPICEKETNNYGCAWGVNKHVHFYCPHCGTNMMQ